MPVDDAALRKMHEAHGALPGKTCADCRYLARRSGRSLSHRTGTLSNQHCALYERTHELKTSGHGKRIRPRWVGLWVACGKFIAGEA